MREGNARKNSEGLWIPRFNFIVLEAGVTCGGLLFSMQDGWE